MGKTITLETHARNASADMITDESIAERAGAAADGRETDGLARPLLAPGGSFTR